MFKKLLFLFLFIVTSSFALTKSEIQAEMTNKIDKVLLVLKDSKLEKDKKAFEIISIMNSVFDYTLMSRLSLGKDWKKISKEQKIEFIKLFTQKLKDSYTQKLDLYTDELVEIVGLEEKKRSRVILKTQLVGKEQRFDINYKFYNKKNTDQWFIYDVDLLGVSIIQTFRKQFSGFLKDKSVEDLIVQLKNDTKLQ